MATAVDSGEEMAWPWRQAEAAVGPPAADHQLGQLLQHYACEPSSSSAYVAPKEVPEHDRVAEWAWGPLMVAAPPPSPGDQLTQAYAGETWSPENVLGDYLELFFGSVGHGHPVAVPPTPQYLTT